MQFQEEKINKKITKNKMTHLKRNKIGKFWAIPRKGTKYLALASHNAKESIPLVIVMRDLLKLVRNKKELKRMLNEKAILINHKEIRETNYPVCLFDIITIPSTKKNFKATISKHKKMVFEEVLGKEAETKLYKVLNKKLLSVKIIQLNLSQGKNILSNEKINIGDSIVLNLKDNKILSIIPIEKGKIAFVLKGKHIGHSGKILEVLERGGKKIAKIESEGKRINVWVKNLIMIK
jgi:small subunit ribosomal protein S4e